VVLRADDFRAVVFLAAVFFAAGAAFFNGLMVLPFSALLRRLGGLLSRGFLA
jgi:hypothetical protein